MNGRVSIVLLIDHDAIQRITVARVLKAAGYCVIPVARVHEALETFATHHVDIALVVANTQTTTSGGPPLLDSLSTIDPFVPVVVLTGGVAIDRPAYEYGNVAATLMKPFAPADVVAAVERVLRGIPFNWPPTEEDLADIQVVDTAEWQTTQANPATAAGSARATPPAGPPAMPVTPTPVTPVLPVMPMVPPTTPPVEVVPEATVAFARPSQAPAMPGKDLVRAAPAPLPARLVAPSLVIRGLEWGRWMPEHRVSARTRRSLAVAATAICGLALTTMLELRIPERDAARVDEAGREAREATEATSVPALAASRHHLDAMSLVSARRVTPRAAADIITLTRRPAPPTPPAPSAPRPDAAPRDAAPRHVAVAARNVPRIETQTAAARTLPSPPVDSAPAAIAAAEPGVTADARPANTPDIAPVMTPAVTSAVTPAITPAVTRPGADERDIYRVLQRYERAYEHLDVNAARAVWPSIDARALARAFDGLKAQALEFSHCRVAFELAEATAICGGSASYVPRVGRQAARTEPRQWTFRLRKVDHDWLIAKAEVR